VLSVTAADHHNPEAAGIRIPPAFCEFRKVLQHILNAVFLMLNLLNQRQRFFGSAQIRNLLMLRSCRKSALNSNEVATFIAAILPFRGGMTSPQRR